MRFGTSSVEPSGSATWELVISKMDLVGGKGMISEGGRWMELAKCHAHWWVLVLAVLKLCFLLPRS